MKKRYLTGCILTIVTITLSIICTAGISSATSIMVKASAGNAYSEIHSFGSVQAIDPYSGGLVEAWASADASGALKAYAKSLQSFNAGGGHAYVYDTFTYYGLSQLLTVNFHVTGTYEKGGSGNEVYYAAYLSGYPGWEGRRLGGDALSGIADYTLSYSLWVNNEQTFDLRYGLEASASSYTYYPYAVTDFGGTGKLGFLGLENGAYVTSALGFDSRENAAPVPEPATMLLMGIGLTGLIATCRKKK